MPEANRRLEGIAQTDGPDLYGETLDLSGLELPVGGVPVTVNFKGPPVGWATLSLAPGGKALSVGVNMVTAKDAELMAKLSFGAAIRGVVLERDGNVVRKAKVTGIGLVPPGQHADPQAGPLKLAEPEE